MSGSPSGYRRWRLTDGHQRCGLRRLANHHPVGSVAAARARGPESSFRIASTSRRPPRPQDGAFPSIRSFTEPCQRPIFADSGQSFAIRLAATLKFTAHAVHTTGWKAAPVLVNRTDPSSGPYKIDVKKNSFGQYDTCLVIHTRRAPTSTTSPGPCVTRRPRQTVSSGWPFRFPDTRFPEQNFRHSR